MQRRFAPIVSVVLASSGFAASPIDLTPRFEPGETVTSVLRIETGQSDEPRGKEAPARRRVRGDEAPALRRAQSHVIFLRTTVTGVVEGVATLESTIESFTIDAEPSSLDALGAGSPGRFVYDSSRPEAARGLAAGQAAVLAGVVGSSFRTEIESGGKVRSMSGLESLSRIMTAPLEGSRGLGALAGALRSAAGDGALSQALSPGFSLIPPEPVRAGETWTSTLDQPLPMIGSARTTWTSRLSRADRRGGSSLATVESTAVIDLKNTEANGVLPTSLITFDQGRGSATTVHDVTRGRAVSSSMELWLPITVRIPLEDPGESVGQNVKTTLVTRMSHEVVGPEPARPEGSPRERRFPR